LTQAAALAGDDGFKQLLIVAQGPDGHPPGAHEYVPQQKLLAELLSPVKEVAVTSLRADQEGADVPAAIRKADSVVLLVAEGGKWIDADPRRKSALAELAQRGGGVAAIHWALGSREAEHVEAVTSLVGACHGGPDRKYKVLTTGVHVAADHPITAGLKDFRIHDEFYYQLKRPKEQSGFTPLLEADIDGHRHMFCWAWQRPDGGRSFGCTSGHFLDNWNRPEYQRLFVQGILWTLMVDPPKENFPPHATVEDSPQPVTGTVVDADGGRPVAARVYLQADSGRWHFPTSESTTESAVLCQREYPATSSVEMHTALPAAPFQVKLPRGKYTLTIERGKEYVPLTRQFTVDDKPIDLGELKLHRFVHLAKDGWFSADTHIHRKLDEMPVVVQAEDLNVAFPLTYWVTTAEAVPATQDNRAEGWREPAAPRQVTPENWLYPLNTEYEIFSVGGKPHTLGAFLLIGHKTPLTIPSPPLAPVADWAHREGGLIDLEKHSWPWSVLLVPLMKPDLYELANNHCWRTEFGFPKWTIETVPDYMQIERGEHGLTEWGWIDFGFQTYYALLNCGFKLAPTAGTAAGVHPVPAGFGRVYVHTGGDSFEYDRWLAALKSGRSFVTTGPLLLAEIDGQQPGHIFQERASGGMRTAAGVVHSLTPLERIEIVVNGRIAETIRELAAQAFPVGDGQAYETRFEQPIRAEGNCWIVVRVFEKHPAGRIRFAHTAPWHCELDGGRPLAPTRDQIDYLIGRCREEIQRNRGVVGPETLAEFERALAAYESISKRVP
jgi:type 1 glutamine amidotransferase